LRTGEADQIAGGIDEVRDGQLGARILHRPHSAPAAEALGFPQGRLDTWDADIEDYAILVAGAAAPAAGNPGPVVGRIATYEAVVPRLRNRFGGSLPVISKCTTGFPKYCLLVSSLLAI
jgi:hypothetical protein